jgi:hypothetical protein
MECQWYSGVQVDLKQVLDGIQIIKFVVTICTSTHKCCCYLFLSENHQNVRNELEDEEEEILAYAGTWFKNNGNGLVHCFHHTGDATNFIKDEVNKSILALLRS